MRVLVTGHDGYIGRVLVPLFTKGGHEVVGLDSCLYAGCALGAEPDDECLTIRKDIRDVEPADIDGFDAVVHLAAISNDPLGDYRPETTYEINSQAVERLAALAKRTGVPRFLFSSSCSVYGAAGTKMLDETAAFNPVTPYGNSKILAEQALRRLADDSFSPVYLRSATAFGVSSRLRGDLVLNNLVGYAYTTGEVLIMSDGTPWRPLVHIEDIARAFLAALEAPLGAVHDEAFNVGRTDENFQVSDIARIVADVVPGSRIVYAPGGVPDPRSYRVDFDKIRRRLPAYEPRWTVRRGAEELRNAYQDAGLTRTELESARFLRIKRVKELQAHGLLDSNLRQSNLADAVTLVVGS